MSSLPPNPWKRALICPGAGWACAGRTELAWLAYGTSLLLMVALGWLAVWPSAIAFWSMLALLVAACFLWLVECATSGGQARQESGLLVRRYVPLAAIQYLAALAAIALCVTQLGVMQVRGDAMQPTVYDGEWILYRRQPAKPLQRGSLVVFQPGIESYWRASGLTGPTHVVGRILAGPGDRLASRRGKFIVNGEPASTARSIAGATAVNVPYTPDQTTVPPGSWFMVSDAVNEGFDSRVLSWVRERTIKGVPVLTFGRRGLAREL